MSKENTQRKQEHLNPDAKALLYVKDLETYFNTEGGVAKAVDGVSFRVDEGEVVGLVGESGSGKSVTSLSIMRLIPNPPGFINGGSIIFKNQDLLALTYPEIRKIRGNEISMIFQEPMTSLNPVLTIGRQIEETVLLHKKCSKMEARDRTIEMLDLVGIPTPQARLNDYPHQFSGGMRQRVMIAIALSCEPDLLIADEPTTALDVTIQAQILELMLKIKEAKSHAAIMLITHDLAVVAESCQKVVVMYCGRIQEISDVYSIFYNSKHPYTRGLLKSIPHAGAKKVHRLPTIPGMVPNIMDLPKGCKFCTRCEFEKKSERCEMEEPLLREIIPGQHFVRCHYAE
ncbi:ABC transporter ATP-binding protein [Candidatus Riflebacteria bacterium]